MALRLWDFDAGPDGAAIPEAGDIINVTGATFTDDAIQGEHAMLAASGSQFIRIGGGAGAPVHSGSMYVRPLANPGSQSGRLLTVTSGSNAILTSCRVHNDGKIDVANAGNARQDVTSSGWTVDQVLRLDWQWDQTSATAPVFTVRVHYDPDSVTPSHTIGFTASVDADAARWQLGAVSATAGWAAVLDTVRLVDELVWLGPLEDEPPPEPPPGQLVGVRMATLTRDANWLRVV